MTKQEHFLWIVQTMILANAVNLASGAETRDRYRHEISATGAFMTMDEAVRASGMIPDDLSAAEAANEFCTSMLSNIRESEASARGTSVEVPSWFARR